MGIDRVVVQIVDRKHGKGGSIYTVKAPLYGLEVTGRYLLHQIALKLAPVTDRGARIDLYDERGMCIMEGCLIDHHAEHRLYESKDKGFVVKKVTEECTFATATD